VSAKVNQSNKAAEDKIKSGFITERERERVCVCVGLNTLHRHILNSLQHHSFHFTTTFFLENCSELNAGWSSVTRAALNLK
jgi:hypothetical protein